MRIQIFLLFLLSFIPLNLLAHVEADVNKSVVQVKVTYQVPNYIRPWQYQNPDVHFSSGVFVSVENKNFILLPVEEILHATLIEVKKFSSYQYFTAKLVKVDEESNLALLEVQNSNFYQDLEQVKFKNEIKYPKKAKVHYLKDSGVLNTSLGDISSMEFDVSLFGFIELPVLNINSSEKLIGNGELVLDEELKPMGILYYFNSNENVGKIIPSFVIGKFLQNYKKEHIFAYKGFKFKSLVDKASRDYYGIKEKNQGVLVSQIISDDSSKLQLEDVILRVGNFKVDSNGYIKHPNYGKQFLSYLFHMGEEWDFTIGKTIPIQIIRNKEILNLEITLKPFPYKAIKITHKREFQKIPYTIQNGFVFLELSKFFLTSWGGNWRNIFRKFAYLYDTQKFYKMGESKNKIIILSQVFPDIANVGYHDLRFQIVKTINDVPIKSIEHLEEEIKKDNVLFQKIKLDNGIVLAIDRKKLPEVNQRIKLKYGINSN